MNIEQQTEQVKQIALQAGADVVGIATVDAWQHAIDFKAQSCRNYARQGIASVTKKYLWEKS